MTRYYDDSDFGYMWLQVWTPLHHTPFLLYTCPPRHRLRPRHCHLIATPPSSYCIWLLRATSQPYCAPQYHWLRPCRPYSYIRPPVLYLDRILLFIQLAHTCTTALALTQRHRYYQTQTLVIHFYVQLRLEGSCRVYSLYTSAHCCL